MSEKYHKVAEELEKTVLYSIEDLINVSFGPLEQNTVNFKLIQTILHILARQMRLLEQEVEIKIDDINMGDKKAKEKKQSKQQDMESSSSTTSESENEDEKRDDITSLKGDKYRDEEGREYTGAKDKGKGQREEGREDTGAKDKGTGQREVKEKEKKEAVSAKERDGVNREVSKGKEKTEGVSPAEKSKTDRDASKDKPDKDRGKKEDGGAEAGGKGKSRDRSAKKSKRGDRDSTRTGDKAGDDDQGIPISRTLSKTEKKSKRKTESKSRGAEQVASRSSITITESDRKGAKGEKVLVVERAQATQSAARVGSIEVVTASQFALLDAQVRQLMQLAGPLPLPSLPANEKLRKDLVKGTASLTDTMQAMQLNARVQAAEMALARMAQLLQQLALAGVVPDGMAEHLVQIEDELKKVAAASASLGTVGKGSSSVGLSKTASVGTQNAGVGAGYTQATGPLAGKSVAKEYDTTSGATVTPAKVELRRGAADKRISAVSAASAGAAMLSGVTKPEMEDVIQTLKEDLVKYISTATVKAAHSSEMASSIAKSVAEKLEIALKVDQRISLLNSQTADYAEQLRGFDCGLATQMASFQEQMAQMRSDLMGGLAQLDQTDTETSALAELNDRYDVLVTELDNTLHANQDLIALQKHLNVECQGLVECVEMLREQKADRDEVLDGLKDKADKTRLAGLLHEKTFKEACIDLERRLELCYEKFKKQDRVWLGAIKDLTAISESKAELMTLTAIKDNVTDELRKIKEDLRQLYIMLGEPKAAILTRKLAKDALCAACLVPALMELTDRTAGKPQPLPALRPTPLGEEAPCTITVGMPKPSETREHVCHRWVGGSHTLVTESVTREKAPGKLIQAKPTKRYAGYGADGKLYRLEEELQPCLECNTLNTEASDPSAAGDQDIPTIMTTPGAKVRGTGDSGVNGSRTTNLAELPIDKEKEE